MKGWWGRNVAVHYSLCDQGKSQGEAGKGEGWAATRTGNSLNRVTPAPPGLEHHWLFVVSPGLVSLSSSQASEKDGDPTEQQDTQTACTATGNSLSSLLESC